MVIQEIADKLHKEQKLRELEANPLKLADRNLTKILKVIK